MTRSPRPSSRPMRSSSHAPSSQSSGPRRAASRLPSLSNGRSTTASRLQHRNGFLDADPHELGKPPAVGPVWRASGRDRAASTPDAAFARSARLRSSPVASGNVQCAARRAPPRHRPRRRGPRLPPIASEHTRRRQSVPSKLRRDIHGERAGRARRRRGQVGGRTRLDRAAASASRNRSKAPRYPRSDARPVSSSTMNAAQRSRPVHRTWHTSADPAAQAPGERLRRSTRLILIDDRSDRAVTTRRLSTWSRCAVRACT